MMLELPPPQTRTSVPLVDCIECRRSIREYTTEPLDLAEFAQLLWAAQGITGSGSRRTTPSPGEFYPLYLHVLVRRVESLEPGIYEYRSEAHGLRFVGKPVSEEAIQAAGIGEQAWLGNAAVVVGIAARLDDINRHFEHQPPRGERGLRYAYMEAGALAQNVQLQTTALDLGCVMVGGFDDQTASDVLQLPADLAPAALLCIGRPLG